MRILRGLVVACACVLAAVMAPSASAVTAGEPANPEAWPWVVALMDPAEPDPYEAHYCSAMQVAAGWYLTAAHCVEDNGRFKAPSELQIGFGSAYLSQITQRVPVQRVVVYPSRKPRGPVSRPYDLAMLWTGVNQGVASPPLSLNWGLLTQKRAWIAGWGRTDTGYPDELMTAQVPVYTPKRCRQLGAPWGTFCAGMFDGRGADACDGDSGGPLMDFDGRFELIGITSFGSKNCNSLGVYTHIGNYRTWITQVIRGRTSGRVSLPEIRSTRFRPVSGNRARADIRWCQTGARGDFIVVEFNAVWRDGRRFITQKVSGTAGPGCMTAHAHFPAHRFNRAGVWRLVAKVHNRTEGLSATEHEAGTVRVS